MLVFHIFAGVIGLLTGVVALALRKGSRWHRKAGNVFFISVLMAAASAMYMSVTVKDEFPFYAIIIFYLTSTSWATIKRPQGKIGRFELIAFLVIAAIAISLITLALDPANGEQGTNESGLYFFFGAVASLATLLDLNMIVRGGLRGGHRIARHLWRMCLSMIAGMASFLDQEQFIPNYLLDTQLLWVPLLLMFMMMVYWLLRVLFTKWMSNSKTMVRDKNLLSRT